MAKAPCAKIKTEVAKESCTMDMVTQDLSNIISNKEIMTVFQPIISLRDGEVLGHEALSRIT